MISGQMLYQLLTVDALLTRDAQTDLGELHRRDRAIGRELAGLAGRPTAQVLAWAERRGVIPDSRMEDVRRVEHGIVFVLAGLGFVLGCVAAAGVLYYEGAGRVNVLATLALLIGVQLLTLALTVILMLPSRWRAMLPGLGVLQTAFSAFSPGRLFRRIATWLAPAAAGRLDEVFAGVAATDRKYGEVRKWLVLRASQMFAVAFNIGLLAVYLALVVFTDLAFGWSTTLDVDAARVQVLVETLARPWNNWLAAAVPSAELVEATRYYRAGGTAVVNAASLGRWWSFLFMCLVTYGLAPRLLLLVFAAWRLDRATRRTLLHLPGVAELRYRLNRKAVETRAEDPESDVPAPTASPIGESIPVNGACVAILWGGHAISDAEAVRVVARSAGLATNGVHRAGIGASLEDDRETLHAAVAFDGPIAIIVKAWEPPLGELIDFIAELRGTTDKERAIIVVPVGEETGAAPRADDMAIWRRRMALSGDPWLSVRGISQEASA